MNRRDAIKTGVGLAVAAATGGLPAAEAVAPVAEVVAPITFAEWLRIAYTESLREHREEMMWRCVSPNELKGEEITVTVKYDPDPGELGW